MKTSQIIYPTEEKLSEYYEREGIPAEKVQELNAARRAYLDALGIAFENRYIDDRIFTMLQEQDKQGKYNQIIRFFPYCEYSEISFCREMRNAIDNSHADVNAILRKAIEYKRMLDRISEATFADGKAWHRYLMERRYRNNIAHGIRSEHMALYDDQESDTRLDKLLGMIEERCGEEEISADLKSNLEVSYCRMKKIREKILNGESITGNEISESLKFYRDTMKQVGEAIGEDPYSVEVEPITQPKDFIPKKPDYAIQFDTAFSRYKEKFIEINAIIWEDQIKRKITFNDRIIFDVAEKGFMKHQIEKVFKESTVHKPADEEKAEP